MDISKFFDRVNHDILMNRIGQTIRDKRVLKLIGNYLRAGAMVEGVVIVSEEGTPQGGPLSPLLANIYLDALDKELERRGLAFSRYADDCNIYVGSRRAAERVLASVTEWIKKHLRLEVNADKSGVGRPWERKFLGFRINREGKIEAAPQSVERLKAKVREMWRSCQSLSSEKLRDRWCAYIRGWWAYYGLAEERRNIFDLEGWIRRHMRKCFWERWHSAAGRLRHLKRLGADGRLLKVGLQQQRRMVHRPKRSPAPSAEQSIAATLRIPYAIRPCGPIRLLRSTAVCGKPHVRWCGRGDGRNPVTSTRSFPQKNECILCPVPSPGAFLTGCQPNLALNNARTTIGR